MRLPCDLRRHPQDFSGENLHRFTYPVWLDTEIVLREIGGILGGCLRKRSIPGFTDGGPLPFASLVLALRLIIHRVPREGGKVRGLGRSDVDDLFFSFAGDSRPHP